MSGPYSDHQAGIFENFVGFNSELSVQLVTKTTILEWLIARVQSKKHDENRGYAAELLSILLQNNRENRLALGKLNGIEAILQVLSVSASSFRGSVNSRQIDTFNSCGRTAIP